MSRLAQIQERITSMTELGHVVTAMRALAGMRMREAQQALPGIRHYAQTIADAIADGLLLDTPTVSVPAAGRTALVLCMAEHGFVGSFNERLFAATQAWLDDDDLLFVMGSRGATLVAEHGREVSWQHAMASRCAGAPDVIDRLSSQLYRHFAQRDVSCLEVVYARTLAGASAQITHRRLLPPPVPPASRPPLKQAPLHHLRPDILYERMLAEYVFAQLTEAAVESLASENAARFAAMTWAHDNVAHTLDTLHLDACQARQSEVTTELLELAAGAQALEDPRGTR